MTDYDKKWILDTLDKATSLDEVKIILAAFIQTMPTENVIQQRAREMGWDKKKVFTKPMTKEGKKYLNWD